MRSQSFMTAHVGSLAEGVKHTTHHTHVRTSVVYIQTTSTRGFLVWVSLNQQELSFVRVLLLLPRITGPLQGTVPS
jgi:hypothetical protein